MNQVPLVLPQFHPAGVVHEVLGLAFANDKSFGAEGVPHHECTMRQLMGHHLECGIAIYKSYLPLQGVNSKFDKNTLKRIEEIELLEEDKKRTLFDVIDTFIRESKGRKAFAL